MTDLESPDPTAESSAAAADESEGHYTSAPTEEPPSIKEGTYTSVPTEEPPSIEEGTYTSTEEEQAPGTYVSTDEAAPTDGPGASDAPPDQPTPS